jgi:hypothetical protein
MDDTRKPAKRDTTAPERPDASAESEEVPPEDGAIDWELTAMLDEGIWSAENEPPVTADELRQSIDKLFANLAEKRARER